MNTPPCTAAHWDGTRVRACSLMRARLVEPPQLLLLFQP